MIAVCPVSLQSLEHWGRTEKGGFSEAQEELVPQEMITEEVGADLREAKAKEKEKKTLKIEVQKGPMQFT